MRQVELRRMFEGVYPISRLTRLNELLLSNDGYVTAKLNFGQSVGFPCLKAKVSASLTLKCQRCLQPMQTEVTGGFKFALVHDEEELELIPDEFEPYLLEGEEQSIIELVEDELILSLPMVTSHSDNCSEFMAKQEKMIKSAKQDAHPFAALKALKNGAGNTTN